MPNLTRRQFIQTAGLLVLARPGSTATARKTIVCVCLRGGLDGLSAVVPYTEGHYFDARRSIAIPPPDRPNGVLPLDARFGLHPRLEALVPLYQAQRLAIVHAAGSPHPTRSHFEAQDYIETGVPGNALLDGWLNRFLTLGADRDHPLRAVAIAKSVPRALRGRAPVSTMNDPATFGVRHPGTGPAPDAAFRSLYGSASDPLSRAGLRALDTVRDVRERAGTPYTPAAGARYPQGGQRLMQVARLIKAGFDVEVAWVDLGGWDTHVGQRGPKSALSGALSTLGASLAAFHSDMGALMDTTVVVTLSEFGRTVAENGTTGTDHGHGGVMLLLGGPVVGGKVAGEWPGLTRNQLYRGRDLEVTTDYRRVLTEILLKHLSVSSVERVFPGFRYHGGLDLVRAS
jgi:uncharacterized protein (DUF1501 family)